MTNLGAYHAHNQWLDVLYIGGIIAFALLLVLFLYAIRINSKSPNIRLQNAINSILLGYFILYITEARRDDLYIYVILIVISHIRELAENCLRNPTKIRRKKSAFSPFPQSTNLNHFPNMPGSDQQPRAAAES